jgi:hypothetical protein
MFSSPFLKEEEEIYYMPIFCKLVTTLILQPNIVLIAKFCVFSVAKEERNLCGRP